MISAVLKELMAAGLAGDALLAAVERIEMAMGPRVSAGAMRTRAWRERKANAEAERHKASQNVTGDKTPPLSPSPSSPPHPPNNPLPLSPPKTTGSARGKTLPSDWSPSEVDLAFAVEMLGAPRAHAEIPKFRDYWHARAGPGSTKRDWSATWRNWIRKASEYGKTQRNSGNSAPNSGSLLGAIEEMRAGLAADKNADVIQFLPARPIPGPEGFHGPNRDGSGSVRPASGGGRDQPTDGHPAQVQIPANYRGSG
jgi:hypothetical protein